jgi:hypothetical protein
VELNSPFGAEEICLAEITTPTSRNKSLNRLPSFDLIFLFMYTGVLFVYLHASRCAVPACVLLCCAALCLCACAWLCACMRLCVLPCCACVRVLCLPCCACVRVLCLPACVCACACACACVRVLLCVSRRWPDRPRSFQGRSGPRAGQKAPDAPLPRLGRLRPWPGRRTRLAPGWQRP